MKETLDIVRSGEFTLHTFGSSHCGTAEHFDVRYHLQVICTPKLDARGFLFDQVNVDKYFQSIGKTDKSCEALVKHCLLEMQQHILTENPACQIVSIKLTLSPHPYMASMTSSVEYMEMQDGYLAHTPAHPHTHLSTDHWVHHHES